VKRSNKSAAGNRHRAFSFDGAMKFEHHPCSQRPAPVAVPELWTLDCATSHKYEFVTTR